jgi:hypothetical protein
MINYVNCKIANFTAGETSLKCDCENQMAGNIAAAPTDTPQQKSSHIHLQADDYYLAEKSFTGFDKLTAFRSFAHCYMKNYISPDCGNIFQPPRS